MNCSFIFRIDCCYNHPVAVVRRYNNISYTYIRAITDKSVFLKALLPPYIKGGMSTWNE